MGDPVDVERIVVPRKDVGADLNHQRSRIGDDRSADEIIHDPIGQKPSTRRPFTPEFPSGCGVARSGVPC
jgi:hypothetical protein